MKLLLPVLALTAAPAFAEQHTNPEVTLTRLDCGQIRVNDLNLFSDVRDYTGESRDLVGSCYLIKHGEDYMLWDTGLPAGLLNAEQNDSDTLSPTLTRTIQDQLSELGLSASDIGMIGISHYHFDHLGQAAEFPEAELVIQKADWDVLSADELPAFAGGFADPSLVQPWLDGGTVTTVTGDHDVFGDGTVQMIDMPGHTPGHAALLVQLPEAGPILLSGDAVHFEEQIGNDGVPTFNVDRADTLASIARMTQLADNLGATLIIQHDARDVNKLPDFPNAAK